MKLFEFTVGDTKPDITGVFPGVDLTGATVTCVLENLADGTSPAWSPGTATITSAAGATHTTVRYTIGTAFAAAAEYVGWFIAVLSSQTYRSSGFVVRVQTSDRTPANSYPAIYGDGRGGYATVNDVNQLDFRRELKTAKVDVPLIETLLGDTAVEIDNALRRYYSVPFTTSMPLALEYIKLIHKYWALAGLYDILAPAGDSEDKFNLGMIYREKGTQLMEDLFTGAVQLTDATAASEKPLSDYEQATIADILDEDEDPAHIPIFSVDSLRRDWRLE